MLLRICIPGAKTRYYTPVSPRLYTLLTICAISLFSCGAGNVAAQINATTNTGWTPWTTSSGVMLDPQGDQQTGQGADDFVGEATRAFVQSQAGTTTFGSGDYLFIRARMDTYDADDKWGNGGNWGIGMDIDGNGSVDMIMMFSESAGNVKNRTHTITFGAPGSGANTSPSTTTWTFPTQTAINLTTNQTYDVQSASTVDGYSFNGTTDAWLTIGLSFAQLQTAIRTYAVGNFSTYVVGL